MVSPKKKYPSEKEEMKIVAEYLNHTGLFWIHVPNEGKRTFYDGKFLKSIGMKSGVPDIIIFNTPAYKYPDGSSAKGLMIELKCITGRITDTQKNFMDECIRLGWFAQVCFGSNQAIRRINMDYFPEKCSFRDKLKGKFNDLESY